jgi:hypothetical protein
MKRSARPAPIAVSLFSRFQIGEAAAGGSARPAVAVSTRF